MDAQIGCLTLPYSEYEFDRALTGIAEAGYDYIGFGTQHQGDPFPDPEAPDADIKEIAVQIRRAGVEPLTFMSGAHLEDDKAVEAYIRKLEIAHIMEMPYMISWGPWEYEEWPDTRIAPELWQKITSEWFERMDEVARVAHDLHVHITLKPHTGVTAHAERLLETVERIGSPAVSACYDPGNVSFYEGIDPAEDIKKCADIVDAVCIKDHSGPRANPNFPAPGEGDVDFESIFRTLNEAGFDGPLMVERFEGVYSKVDMTEDFVDRRAEKTREFLERITLEIE